MIAKDDPSIPFSERIITNAKLSARSMPMKLPPYERWTIMSMKLPPYQR